MENNRQVSTMQASAVLISTIIGVGILPLPLFASRVGGSGAPLYTLMGILLASASVFCIALLGTRFQQESLIQYSERVIGKFLSRFINMLLILFFIILTGLAAREFGEVVVTSVLRQTPIEVTVIVMLLLAALTTRQTITQFAYVHVFYLPFILTPVIMIVIFSFKNAELVYVQPILGNFPENWFRGMVTIAALFQSSFIFSMVIPHMKRPANVMKASLAAMIVTGILYLAIVIAAVAVFGTEEINRLLWPTLELAKMTALPANILERLDVAFLAVWVTAVFTTLFSGYYFSAYSIAELLRLKDHKLFSYILIPFIFIVSMLPENVLLLYEIVTTVGSLGLILTVGYPVFLYLIALIRRTKGGKARGITK